MHEFMKTIISTIKSWVSDEIHEVKNSVSECKSYVSEEIKLSVKNSVADWNQNDANVDNYIKNRTHWEEKSSEAVLSETLLNFSDCQSVNWNQKKDGYLYEYIPLQLVVGQEYEIIFDGVIYYCVAFVDDAWDNIVIGNEALVNNIGDDNDIPFAIGNYNEGNKEAYIIALDKYSHTFTISIVTSSIIHKLDSKFLPDDIGMQSDWNETDETSKSYIQNKPSIYNDKDGNVCLTNGEKLATENYVHETKNGIIIKDEANGYDYVVSMKNGMLVSYRTTDYITVASPPNRTSYLIGDPFIPDGMIVTATSKDGTTREITNYAYDAFITEENINNFTIRYIEGNNVFNDRINISLHDFSLIDFNYITNDDGTYTLTSWKGTHNGEPSTQIVVPNSGLIIVN